MISVISSLLFSFFGITPRGTYGIGSERIGQENITYMIGPGFQEEEVNGASLCMYM